jgi:hypothetical protein
MNFTSAVSGVQVGSFSSVNQLGLCNKELFTRLRAISIFA